MMAFTKTSNDAPIVTMALGIITIVAIPIILYTLFSVWPESLARQIITTIALLCLMAFTVVSRKYEALLLLLLFFSQFGISLHTFHLDPPAQLQIFLNDVFILLLILVALEKRLTIHLDIIAWLFLALLGWFGVAAYYSTHPHQSLVFLSWQLKYLALYILALNTPLSESLVKRMTYVVALVICIQSLIAVAQLIHGGWLGLNILGEPIKVSPTIFLKHGVLRVAGTIGASNGFAGYIAMLLVLLVPFIMTRRNFFLHLGFGIGVASLILALSRAGWLSFLLGGLCTIFMMKRERLISFPRIFMVGIIGLLLITAGVSLYFDQIMSRFYDRQAISSAEGRIEQFPIAMKVIKEHLLVGIGPGVTDFFGVWNDNLKYIQTKLPNTYLPNQAHSSQLQVCLESGIPGLLLFLSIIGAIFCSVFLHLKHSKETDNVALFRIGGICAAVAVMTHISFGTEFNTSQIITTFWILLGLCRSRQIGDQNSLNLNHS